MTLRLSYFVAPAPLTVAREHGLLDEIDLKETRTVGSPEQLSGLIAGELDAVVTAIDNLFEWSRGGADVRLVGQVEPTTPLAVIGSPDLADLTDLEGRRFAVDAYDNGFALVARHLLAQKDVTVDWIEVGGVAERLDALLTHEVDATLLGPPFDDRATAAGHVVLASAQDTFPSFPGQGLVVRTPLLGTAELEAFLTALRSCGLVPVEETGLETLTRIRADLGLLAPGDDLRTLLATP
ncbi:ABC transporter substrate-binding protein [Agromyces soli]